MITMNDTETISIPNIHQVLKTKTKPGSFLIVTLISISDVSDDIKSLVFQ